MGSQIFGKSKFNPWVEFTFANEILLSGAQGCFTKKILNRGKIDFIGSYGYYTKLSITLDFFVM